MPLYAQLTRAIRFAIATGRLQVGEQLPTVRQLAVELRVNANTVAKVYTELERSGILETRRGVGTFVSARHSTADHRDEHENHLVELVDRFVEEAGAMGFSVDDLLNQLQSRRK
jgi:GntR family transcriptional regulator